jgi:hypothetical protein
MHLPRVAVAHKFTFLNTEITLSSPKLHFNSPTLFGLWTEADPGHGGWNWYWRRMGAPPAAFLSSYCAPEGLEARSPIPPLADLSLLHTVCGSVANLVPAGVH